MTALVMSVALLAAQASFVLIGTRQQVSVYQVRDTSAIILRAEGEMPASPQAVLELLLDYPRHVGLVSRLRDCRVLARGDGEIYVYQRLELPVIKDRDFTLHVRWHVIGNSRTVRSSVDHDHTPPPVKGVVRLPRLNGYWELEPVHGGTATHARYTVEIDFGGSVPRSMVRAGAIKDLPAMFQRFRDELVARRDAH